MTSYTRKHSHALRIEGIAVVLLGVLAILLPTIATLGIGLLVGGLLFVAGVFNLQRAWQFRGFPGFGWSMAGAVLLALAGLFFLLNPGGGAALLTVILVVLFLFEGVVEIAFALQHRWLRIWGWIMASGIASLAIALLLLAHWPSSAAWAIGLLVGINLLFTGIWLLAMSSAVKSVEPM